MARNFDNAHDFRINKFQVFNGHPSVMALEKLQAQIAAGAIHDSKERCDAPKCHPDTRVAVQDDLHGWILDEEFDQPKIKWVTGPAGSGKTAILGSLARRCKPEGVLAATFFFASWSASIGRRRKTALITTIAHQLTQHDTNLRNEISKAIEVHSDIFDKDLHTQMEILIRSPLQKIASRAESPRLRGVIIIDGLDECEAEQYHDPTSTGSKAKCRPPRTKDQDQLEILQVLQAASLDPSFPFRIIIASRPERVFRLFFDPEHNATPIADKLDLHEQYSAHADITLFLEVQFNQIRRRFNLPPSWLPADAIKILVARASGQFIYAATIIRFLEVGHRETPKVLLEAILKMEATGGTTSNPLEQLDALYTHILNSSPDPPLSVRWVCSIARLNRCAGIESYASHIHLLLPTDPESNEAEHLLGNLHSLVKIPPPSDQATTKYHFYHKTVFDFLEDPDRCGILYVGTREVESFIWDACVRVCARNCDALLSYPANFVEFLVIIPWFLDPAFGSAHSEVLPTPTGADWWVSSAFACGVDLALWKMFKSVHKSCSWRRCKPACKTWSCPILARLGSSSASWVDRTSRTQEARFYASIKEARKAAQKKALGIVNELDPAPDPLTTMTMASTAAQSMPPPAPSSAEPKMKGNKSASGTGVRLDPDPLITIAMASTAAESSTVSSSAELGMKGSKRASGTGVALDLDPLITIAMASTAAESSTVSSSAELGMKGSKRASGTGVVLDLDPLMTMSMTSTAAESSTAASSLVEPKMKGNSKSQSHPRRKDHDSHSCCLIC